MAFYILSVETPSGENVYLMGVTQKGTSQTTLLQYTNLLNPSILFYHNSESSNEIYRIMHGELSDYAYWDIYQFIDHPIQKIYQILFMALERPEIIRKPRRPFIQRGKVVGKNDTVERVIPDPEAKVSELPSEEPTKCVSEFMNGSSTEDST
jgi:hypothetical protein